MIEYKRHIDEYLNYAFSSFSKLVSLNQWGNKRLAESYLQKYWLREQEYLAIWKPIQDKIFFQNKNFPDLIYNNAFDVIILKSGCLFIEEDFNQLKAMMTEIGEKYFVIIQHSQEFTRGEPMFRMKFPVNISWEELVSGNYISSVLFEMPYNEYYVFGYTATWGKYSANDYNYPLDIIGFKPEFKPFFKRIFKQTKEDLEEVSRFLPLSYLNLINKVQ